MNPPPWNDSPERNDTQEFNRPSESKGPVFTLSGDIGLTKENKVTKRKCRKISNIASIWVKMRDAEVVEASCDTQNPRPWRKKHDVHSSKDAAYFSAGEPCLKKRCR